MVNGKRVIVVLPAYNAEKTLEMTVNTIPDGVVDDIILVDDSSIDLTVAIAKKLNLKICVHEKNMGYGANQKTCYREALRQGADIVIMLHPDYQYTPALIPAIASMVAYGEFDAVLASRILGIGALKGGMPLYKYVANRFLTFVQNILIGHKLSEYHTGYRAFSRETLEKIPLYLNSDDFIFDNEMISQIIWCRSRVGEISCPTRYFAEASSINFFKSLVYGLGVIKVSVLFRLCRMRILRSAKFTCNF
jgi:Glycosyltransferases involved in cell wall biogenesis